MAALFHNQCELLASEVTAAGLGSTTAHRCLHRHNLVALPGMAPIQHRFALSNNLINSTTFCLLICAGGTALRGGQLRALNQSVSTQVAALMQVREPGRMGGGSRLGVSLGVLCCGPDQPASERV